MAEKKVKNLKEQMFKPNPDDSPNSGVKPNLERPAFAGTVESGISSDMINPDGSIREKIPAQFDPMGPRVNSIKEVANQRIKQNLKNVAKEAANKIK